MSHIIFDLSKININFVIDLGATYIMIQPCNIEKILEIKIKIAYGDTITANNKGILNIISDKRVKINIAGLIVNSLSHNLSQ